MSELQSHRKARGTVFLVAAGPGDPSLLTLRAVELLNRGDVVLYDALANPAVLSHTRKDAICISVGKHGKGRVWSQNEIHQEILRHAEAGKSVVRLKGGDTSIFARTGEEIEFLRDHDLSFEVVPGVTAASAAAAFAGVPLTHRDWASAVAFVTGHQQAIDGADEADDDLDWNSLAKFPGTLVLYMAVTNTRRWSQALIQGGLPDTTPVAIVRNASLPIQSTIMTTLREVTAVVEGPPKLRPPVIFIVGSVTRLRETMDWFTKRPLYGKSILLTRPAEQNQEIADALSELGCNVLIQPAIALHAPDPSSQAAIELESCMDRIDQFDWIVFSSANGVRFWFDAFFAKHQDLRKLGKIKFAGVGPSIQSALEKLHLQCDVCLLEDCNAETLAASLRLNVANQRVLLVTTNQARTTLFDELSKLADVQSVVAYLSEPITKLDEGNLSQLSNHSTVYVLASSVAIAEATHRLLASLPCKVIWLSLSDRIRDLLKSYGQESILPIQNLSPQTIATAMSLSIPQESN